MQPSANLITEDRWGALPLLCAFWGGCSSWDHPVPAQELSITLPRSSIQLYNDGVDNGEAWHAKGKHWGSIACETSVLHWRAANWLGSFAWRVCLVAFIFLIFWGTVTREYAFSVHVRHVRLCGSSCLQHLMAWSHHKHDSHCCFWMEVGQLYYSAWNSR